MSTTQEHRQPAALRRSARQQPPEVFGPDSMLWSLTGDTRALTTIAAPLIMQAMHPAIGAAVEKYSVYRTDPWGRAVRSFDSIMLWVYGGKAAIEEGRRLRELHKPIQGEDDHGNRYHALNPGPYAWVHGTVFAWMVTSHPLLYGKRLTDEQEERLYSEVLRLGRILGVRDRDMPQDRAGYWEYYEDMVRNTLENHPAAQNVLTDMRNPLPPPVLPRVLRPLWPPLGKVVGRAVWLLTVATMPESVRRTLQLRWTEADDRKARSLFRVLRVVYPLLPERLRYMPIALHARRHGRAINAARRRATVSVV